MSQMDTSIQRFVDKICKEMDAEKSGHLYTFLLQNIEDAKNEGMTGVMIDNSEGLSTDKIHRWFPTYSVGWTKNNKILISWKD